MAISSDNGYVDVESVRFKGDSIGINGDNDLITLTNGVVFINGKIIHSGTTDHTGDFEVGTDKFNIASNTGNTAIAGTLDVTGATSLASTLEVNSTLTVSDNVKLTEDNAVIEHTSTASGASLTIKSNTGYVDVESVRFTDDYIGISGDTDIIQLTSTGSQATVAIVADVDVTGKMDVSSDFAVGTTKFKVAESSGAVSMSSDEQTITHDGATSLTIASSEAAAFVKIEGGSSAYVQVESVKITDDQIGTLNDADLIKLENNKMSLDGALDLKVDAATVTHTGTTSLAISSTNGHITIAGGSDEYVDIESVRFTDDYIGISGDTDIIQLTSTGSQATVAIVADVDVTGKMDVSSDFAVGTTKFKVAESSGAVSMSSDEQTITHDGATSLTIASSEAAAFVKIEGGSSAYVQVESVKITDDQIGTLNDADLIKLENNKMSLDGALDLKVDAATVTHTGTTSLAISSTNGHITIAGGSDEYVDIESVRFTDAAIGTTGDADLITLADKKVTVMGTLTTTDDIMMSNQTAALTHDSDTGVGLAITSTNGYVEVESVRFMTNQIGLAGTDGLVTLSSSGVDIAGSLDTDGPFKVADTKFTIDVSGNTYADGSLGVKGLSTLQNNLELNKIDAAIKHTGTGATTGLTISSDNGYVDVESVRFTNASIGTTTDVDLMNFMNAAVTIKGSLDTDGYIKVATNMFTWTPRATHTLTAPLRLWALRA